jgi:hypothetical protein
VVVDLVVAMVGLVLVVTELLALSLVPVAVAVELLEEAELAVASF